MTAENPWTESVTLKMVALWGEGRTASEIARDLNKEFNTRFSRSAVISKGRKLGVQRRRGPGAIVAAKTPISHSALKIRQIQADSQRTDLKSLIDLKANECHWPIHDREDPRFGFCGHNKIADSPYCKAHHKLAYTTPKVYSHSRITQRERV